MLEAQLAMVQASLDGGQPDKALAQMRGILRENPENAKVHNLMGLTQLAMRNHSRAIRHLRFAHEKDGTVGTGLNLSSAMIEAGDHNKAIALLKKLITEADKQKYPYKERLLHNMGYAWSRSGSPTKALSWFRQATEENPAFFPTHMEMGRLYEKSARPALAMKSYRQAVDYCHVCYEPVEALTRLYMSTGRYGDARQILIRFGRTEGIADKDKKRAAQLLRNATTAGLPAKKKG